MSSNYLDGVTIVLSELAETYDKESIINVFQNNTTYKIHTQKVASPELFPDEAETEVFYQICGNEQTPTDTVPNPNGIYSPEYDSLELKLIAEDWESEVSHLERVLESAGLDFLRTIRYSYSRKLDVDEGRITKFTDSIVDEIEELGYDVSTERSSGTYIDAESKNITKEYKTWFYIDDSDEENSCPHHVNITFTEDGPFLCGTVLEGEEHEADFRRLLTDFSTA